MDLFATLNIITFFASIGFGLFVYSKNVTKPLNKAWFLFSIAIAIWAFSLYIVVTIRSEIFAFIFQSVLDISAVFMGALYFNFISIFLELKNKKERVLIVLLAVFLSFFTLTSYFKTGVSLDFGFYWVQPGKFYFVLPLFFAFYVFSSVYFLIKAYITASNQNKKKQIQYHIIAAIIGFGGGSTNFLPQLVGFFLPIGNYFLLLYIFFLSFSILQHQLFNTKTIAAELLNGAVWLILLLNFLVSTDSFSGKLLNLLFFVFAVVFGVILVRSVNKDVKIREHIEKLAKQLSNANLRLEDLEKQKTEFVSIASHQLRTPLTAIKGYASMLTEGSFGTLSNEAKQAVEKIFRSSQRLVVIIQDFLMVSRIEQGRVQYEFEPIELKKAVKEVIADIKPTAKEKGLGVGLQLDSDGDFTVKADREKLKQAIYNIVANAIRYTDKGLVRISLSKDIFGKKVRIAISDTGKGIASDSLEKIFEKFSGADDKNRLSSGIGLFVAREIITAHRGRVWAESAGPGYGSTFFVELPAGK